MSFKNYVSLVGNVGQTPELKHTSNGKAYLNVSLAVNKTYKDKDGDKKTVTNWFNFTLWEKQAEVMSKYIKKGTQLGIDAELYTRKRDVEGTEISCMELKVNGLELLSSGSDSKEDVKQDKKSKGKKESKKEEVGEPQEPTYADDNIAF